MHFLALIIPNAYAFDGTALGSALKPIFDNVIYPIVDFLFVLAVFFFAWGVMQMIWKDGAEAREKGRNHILFGVIGMFIMLSAWGIIYFVSNSVKSIGQTSTPQTQTITAPGSN